MTFVNATEFGYTLKPNYLLGEAPKNMVGFPPKHSDWAQSAAIFPWEHFQVGRLRPKLGRANGRYRPDMARSRPTANAFGPISALIGRCCADRPRSRCWRQKSTCTPKVARPAFRDANQLSRSSGCFRGLRQHDGASAPKVGAGGTRKVARHEACVRAREPNLLTLVCVRTRKFGARRPVSPCLPALQCAPRPHACTPITHNFVQASEMPSFMLSCQACATAQTSRRAHT